LLAGCLAGWLGTWLAGWLAGLLGRPGVPGGHRKGPGEPGGARLSCLFTRKSNARLAKFSFVHSFGNGSDPSSKHFPCVMRLNDISLSCSNEKIPPTIPTLATGQSPRGIRSELLIKYVSSKTMYRGPWQLDGDKMMLISLKLSASTSLSSRAANGIGKPLLPRKGPWI
jgi:hypothetical protein